MTLLLQTHEGESKMADFEIKARNVLLEQFQQKCERFCVRELRQNKAIEHVTDQEKNGRGLEQISIILDQFCFTDGEAIHQKEHDGRVGYTVECSDEVGARRLETRRTDASLEQGFVHTYSYFNTCPAPNWRRPNDSRWSKIALEHIRFSSSRGNAEKPFADCNREFSIRIYEARR